VPIYDVPIYWHAPIYRTDIDVIIAKLVTGKYTIGKANVALAELRVNARQQSGAASNRL